MRVSLDLLVYDRTGIERLEPPPVPHAIVSVTSAPDDRATFPESASCRGVLRLAFLDVDVVIPRVREEDLFSAVQARRVWDFVLAHRGGVDRMLVHCDAGKSRAPAIAAAIAKIFDGDDARWFAAYTPNPRVYQTLLDVYRAEYT
jgi:predicted protein tyrosine phosphatase